MDGLVLIIFMKMIEFVVIIFERKILNLILIVFILLIWLFLLLNIIVVVDDKFRK